jgi:hypothetical protein
MSQKFKQCYYIEKESVLDASLIVITGCLCTVRKVGPASSLLLTSLFYPDFLSSS